MQELSVAQFLFSRNGAKRRAHFLGSWPSQPPQTKSATFSHGLFLGDLPQGDLAVLEG